jgi:hypothetical protein
VTEMSDDLHRLSIVDKAIAKYGTHRVWLREDAIQRPRYRLTVETAIGRDEFTANSLPELCTLAGLDD